MPPDRTISGASKSKPFKPVRPTASSSSAALPSSGISKPTQTKNRTHKPSQLQSPSQSQTQKQSRLSSTSNPRPRPRLSNTSRNDDEVSGTSDDASDDDDDDDENHVMGGDRGGDRGWDAEEGDESNRSTIPPPLLTRLLHEFFTEEGVRISRGADRAVGKYMETFVREAVARAAYDKGGRVGGEEVEDVLGLGTRGGFLEVEDLEKLAPQLVLDF